MRNPRQGSRRVGTAALIATSLLLVVGCGSGGQAQHGATTIRVSERDFKMSASAQVLARPVTSTSPSTTAGQTRTS